MTGAGHPTCFPRAPLTALSVAAFLLSLAIGTGCAVKLPAWQENQWINGYESAEILASERGTGIVFCYRDAPANRPDATLRAACDVIADGSRSDYVRCVLAKDYSPDRKYVAQFGVDRSPALIVLHPDGTYHAHTGLMGSEGVGDFLANANPPGKTPSWNPFVHREPRYAWLTSTEEGEAAARAMNRPILIVFHRPWSNDLQRLRRMLREPAVFRRFSEMIHVRSGSLLSFSDAAETKYGTLQLPAIVIAQPDGTHRVLELPNSYDAIIRFADNTETNGDARATEASVAAPVLGSN